MNDKLYEQAFQLAQVKYMGRLQLKQVPVQQPQPKVNTPALKIR